MMKGNIWRSGERQDPPNICLDHKLTRMIDRQLFSEFIYHHEDKSVGIAMGHELNSQDSILGRGKRLFLLV
jgi:hypothetical protein